MPNDPSRGRSWRQNTGGTEKKREAQPQWRREPATPGAPVQRLTRKTKIAATGIGFLVFCALLIWAVMLLIPPKAACLVPIYAGYEDNLAVPANVYGRTSILDLVKLTESGSGSFFWGSGLLHLKSNPIEYRTTDESWDKDLESFKEKTVVIFMALHGGSDREGAYLLPANSNGRPVEKNRLRMSQVFERLSHIDKDKNKVLILDATQISADWPLGILDNGFARKLGDLESKISGIPNLVVLSASDADQRSWVSDEWRQTVFAHFVIEGLKGAADESRGGRINALNLYNYVQKNVTNWVRSNRNALQQPVMLPSGQAGKDRASRMDLVVVKEAYQAPNPKETKEFKPPDDLLAAWQSFQKLDKEVPSPAVYSPNLWRQYQEFLLRFELMIRVGDSDLANAMLNKVKDLGSQIVQARSEKLNSAQNSNPMPAAAGLGRWQPDLLIKQFGELWDLKPDDWAGKWDGILKSAKANSITEKQVLRVQMADLLIKKVAENPRANLEKGAKLARTLEDKVSPRPAELHFLVMLNRDRVVNPQPDSEYYSAIKAALELRLLAEKTAFNLSADGHPYSERVYPWIKSPVELADDSRRIGQDLLFASNPSSWTEAMKSFKTAEKNYLKAREIGTGVRSGLAARDLAYEVLPAFSKWAALRRPSDQTQRRDQDDELLRSIEGLWQEVHWLDRQLEKPNPDLVLVKDPPKVDSDDSKPLNIVDRADLINSGIKKLRKQFDEVCQKLAVSGADLQTEWHDTEGALSVPFMDPALRMRLLTSSRRTSLHLLTESGDKPSDAGSAGEEEKKQPRKEAIRQGKMALAGLGKTWFDLCKIPNGELEEFASVMGRMKTALDDSNWANSISAAEDQIGIRCQQMPNEISARGDAAPKAKLPKAEESLEYADQLARIMDPGSNALATHDAVKDYRSLLFLSFLNWQAQRTYEDHWFDVTPDLPPYYQSTGTMLLDDAAKMVPQQPDRLQILEDLRKKIGWKGRLEAVGPKRLSITSEREFEVSYQIRPPKDETIPHGFPVLGIKPGKDLEFVNAGDAVRAVHELTGNDQPLAPISVKLQSPLLKNAESNPPARPDPVPTSISLDGLYRGQVIPGEIKADLYPLPEIAQVQPQTPPRASLAVRADPGLLQHDPTKSAVMIMLDCSGSMCTPYDTTKDFLTRAKKNSRFDRAVVAIGRVLDGIKKGTNVSFWVFSDKQAGGPVGRKLRDLKPWDRDQKDGLMKQILNLHPYYETPLVRTIWESRGEFAAELTGFKSMVVLTDGADSEFKNDTELQKRGRTIPEFLANEFKNSGIQLNVVFYEPPENEKKAILDNFKCIEDKTWPTPGKMYLEEDADKLTAYLLRALRPNLRYWVENPDGTAPPGLNDSLEVSQKGSNYQWIPGGLAAKSYNLWAQQTDRDRQKINFERGDMLLLQLTPKLRFERLLFSDEFPGKIKEKNDAWRLTPLQNQKVGDRGLQMLLTLEKQPDQNAATVNITLQQVKPQEAWFEIQPTNMVKGLFGVRWGYQYGYPAAAWGFDVPDWPQALGSPIPASPRVQAWWSEQEADSSKVLQQGPDFSIGSDLINHNIQVEDDKVIIESVRVEDHLVEVVRGQKPELQSCLVVRMEYPPNKPVWAKVTGGWNIEGYEHRFYQAANKYTGLFWPVPAKGADNLTKLSVISLDAFKRQAKQRGFYIDLKDAQVPESGDYRPTPIELNKRVESSAGASQ
jgi:hypothetical protein